MFTSEQLQSLDSNYFIIIYASRDSIVLQSKCTGHQWHIFGAGYCDQVLLEHRHSANDPWHGQAFYGTAHTFKGAIKAIHKHDNYQLHKDKEKRRQRTNRLYR